jgi:hypothetical protein
VYHFNNYDLARRLETRKRLRNVFSIWLLNLGIAVVVSVIGGGVCSPCAIPFAIMSGLIVVTKGIQLYNESPARTPSTAQTEQELFWLYGEHWQGMSGPEEQALAEDRIRKRRSGRWLFVVHLVLFALVNSVVVHWTLRLVREGGPEGLNLLIFPVVWSIFLISRFVHAFPTEGRLRRRERAYAQALETEMERLRPSKRKHSEKPKRDRVVILSEDGELIEMPEETEETEAPEWLSEKPKRGAIDGT